MPLLQKRLSSFDPATVNAAGNNALHELCRLFTLTVRDEYDCKLAEQLIELGVNVHARNQKGRTPLLEYAATSATVRSADGIRLLLAHGADLNAQDGDGNSALHHIVKTGALLLLEDLLDGSDARCLDLWAVNRAGRTAVDAANFAGSAAAGAAQLLQTQLIAWKQSVQPLLLDAFNALLIPDLAAVVMGYLDGSGLPFRPSADQADADSGAAAAGVVWMQQRLMSSLRLRRLLPRRSRQSPSRSCLLISSGGALTPSSTPFLGFPSILRGNDCSVY
jgi:ankyrin repeat protein